MKVRTGSFRFLYFSRDSISIVAVGKMIPAGHVGVLAVEMWGGVYWGSLKERGNMEALVLDRITALKRILTLWPLSWTFTV